MVKENGKHIIKLSMQDLLIRTAFMFLLNTIITTSRTTSMNKVFNIHKRFTVTDEFWTQKEGQINQSIYTKKTKNKTNRTIRRKNQLIQFV